MRLLKVLDRVNQIEKISFLKILDGFCSELRKTTPQIDKIISEGEGQLKNVENNNLVSLFQLLRDKYSIHLQEKIKFSDYPLDILVDILIRDGNTIMSREWFSRLYNQEISKLKSNITSFSTQLDTDRGTLDPQRKRDYLIYRECVRTGYENDLQRNREEHLSWEEKSILHTLSISLELSNEEVRWITYTIVPLKKFNIDDIITELKESGIIFFNRKSNTVFVPNEVVWLLREMMGIEIPNKFVRRILRNLTNPEINLVSRKHNIDRKLDRNGKIQEILRQGISVTNLLSNDIFRPTTSKSERNNRIRSLMIKELEVDLDRTGRSLEEKISNLIDYFNETEMDETTSLSKDGYKRLLKDFKNSFPNLNKTVKEEFQLQDDDVMSCELLENYNIKPRDVLYLLTKNEIRNFCKSRSISTRGNLVSNAIKSYRDIGDLLIENFELVGQRDLNSLRDKGLIVKESELGSLYEKLTKKIFTKLGFNVDEKLRKTLNTKRLRMDVLLNLGNRNVIIIECKTVKDKDYNKYTLISRQLKSYEKICQNKGYNVSQVLVVSNDFSDEFIGECEYDYELNLSLITSKGLVKILDGYKESYLSEFPVKLLLKDGLLNEDRIVKVLTK
ncbi:MAG: hypothetical protein ISR95_05155 [Candidatus Marinimicrobia bacterium]|nr:hypothetical protein [Candidatus Neomarinimicrobiota bacterium]